MELEELLKRYRLVAVSIAPVLFSLIGSACNYTPGIPATIIASRPTIGVTPSPTYAPECYFNWATHDVPELSAKLQAEIDDTSLDGVKIEATGYGEDCIDPATHKAKSFGAMQTDFHIEYIVKDFADLETIGNTVAQVLVILNRLKPETLPGRLFGRIEFWMRKGEQLITILAVSPADLPKLVQSGLKGAALLRALNYKH